MVSNVILLFGSKNRERRVSVASAQSILRNLEQAPTCWFWGPDDKIYEVQPNDVLAHKDPFLNDIILTSPPLFCGIDDALSSSEALGSVFLIAALHGVGVEDGDLQYKLESQGLPYTGSDSQASQLAFNKIQAKACISLCGINIAQELLIQLPITPAVSKKLFAFLGNHKKIVLKPACEGSSFGCFVVDSPSALKEALNKIPQERSQDYLAESFVEGTEVSVGVIDTLEGPQALCGTQIVPPADSFFDFEAKYLGAAKEITPTQLPEKVLEKAQEVAVLAHKSIEAYGYSRIDMIIHKEQPIFLELNTLPGLSKASIINQQFAYAGFTFGEFLQNQLDLAIRRNQAH